MKKERLLFLFLLFSFQNLFPYEEPYLSPPSQCTRRSLPKNREIFASVDLLVWDAREEGLEYAYQNANTQFSQELSSLEPPSKFEPAFRISLGGFLPYDAWTLGAVYTYYHTDRHSSGSLDFNPAGEPGPGMIAVWTYPSAFFNNNNGARFASTTNEWKLHTSFLDLALSRSSKIASYFAVTPSFGIRSAWLHQRYQVNYSGGNIIAFGTGNQVTLLTSSIDSHSDSNNVGLLFGCGFQWTLAKNWDFFSDLSAALLASHFNVKRSETDLFFNQSGTLETELISLKSTYWSFRPQAQLALGIQFSDTFRYGSRFVRYRISAAYEAQMWWKQNQLLRYIDVQNTFSSGANVTPSQGDLMFHGADLEIGFDF